MKVRGHGRRRRRRAKTLLAGSAGGPPAVEFGPYDPLQNVTPQQIHEAALRLLDEVGFEDAPSSTIELLTAKGGYLNDAGRLCLPPALVEDVIARTCRSWVLHGRGGRDDIEIAPGRVIVSTAGGAVLMLDLPQREFRYPSVADAYRAARLIDACEYIHLAARPIVIRDIDKPSVADLNLIYATARGTTKPFSVTLTNVDHVEPALGMLDIIAGGEGTFVKRPFFWTSNAVTVSPLRIAADSAAILEASVRRGVPYLALCVPLAGTTGPASLTGTLVLAVAEALFAFAHIDAIRPGHPTAFGCMPFVTDLRTGATSGGGGEQALLMAGAARMGRFYDVPYAGTAGMSDAKEPDVQAGFEKGHTITALALAGANILACYPGVLASLMAFNLEQLLIDDEMIGNVLRTVQGFQGGDEALSIDVIVEAVTGEGHFLSHPQTLQLMTAGFLYPELSDRSSTHEWVGSGRPDIVEKAAAKVAELLAGPRPDGITTEADRAIRAQFDIRLPETD